MNETLEEFGQRGRVVTYPVERVGSRAAMSIAELQRSAGKEGELWQLHQAVFAAKMEALKVMIKEGYQPVTPARVSVIVEVLQHAVSDEAGDVGMVREDMHHLSVYRYEGLGAGPY